MVRVWVIWLSILVAGFIGTVAGFGISTTMMPVVLLFYSASTALLITGIIHWWVSLWKVLFFQRALDMHILYWFGIPSLVASAIGAYLATHIAAPFFTKIIGGYLVIYALVKLIKPKLNLPENDWGLAFGGLLSGFCAGLFGIRGAITSSFLQVYALPQQVYLMTIGIIALAIDTVRVFFYLRAFGGNQPSVVWSIILVGIPLSFLSAWFGQRLVRYMPQQLFYTLIAWFMLFVGIRLMLF